jgi:hypothetical protein
MQGKAGPCTQAQLKLIPVSADGDEADHQLKLISGRVRGSPSPPRRAGESWCSRTRRRSVRVGRKLAGGAWSAGGSRPAGGHRWRAIDQPKRSGGPAWLSPASSKVPRIYGGRAV